jgi:hypothetical protein
MPAGSSKLVQRTCASSADDFLRRTRVVGEAAAVDDALCGDAMCRRWSGNESLVRCTATWWRCGRRAWRASSPPGRRAAAARCAHSGSGLMRADLMDSLSAGDGRGADATRLAAAKSPHERLVDDTKLGQRRNARFMFGACGQTKPSQTTNCLDVCWAARRRWRCTTLGARRGGTTS